MLKELDIQVERYDKEFVMIANLYRLISEFNMFCLGSDKNGSIYILWMEIVLYYFSEDKHKRADVRESLKRLRDEVKKLQNDS